MLLCTISFKNFSSGFAIRLCFVGFEAGGCDELKCQHGCSDNATS